MSVGVCVDQSSLIFQLNWREKINFFEVNNFRSHSKIGGPNLLIWQFEVCLGSCKVSTAGGIFGKYNLHLNRYFIVFLSYCAND